MTEGDIRTGDGRTLHWYAGDEPGRPVFWLHGTPNTGALPEPLFAAARAHGLRWVGYDRPGYGGSTPAPGRAVADAAADVAAVADALGLDRFAVLGHSGGGPHALACAALLPGRVTAVVGVSGPAPYGADGLDFYAGMADGPAASLRAAAAGRAAKEAYEAADLPFDEASFTVADYAALAAEWSWFDGVVAAGQAHGPGALIDDDLALTAPWGFDPAAVAVPALVLHGTDDRMIPAAHGTWLAGRIPGAELRLRPGHGHISVLRDAPAALAWPAL